MKKETLKWAAYGCLILAALIGLGSAWVFNDLETGYRLVIDAVIIVLLAAILGIASEE